MMTVNELKELIGDHQVMKFVDCNHNVIKSSQVSGNTLIKSFSAKCNNGNVLYDVKLTRGGSYDDRN